MLTSRDFPAEPFTPGDARDLGITRRQLRDGVRQSLIVQVLRGVYVRGDLELDTRLCCQAAMLVVNEKTVICDRTAAWLHGVDVMRFGELDQIPRLEGYVLRGRHPTDRPECSGGQRDLRPVDCMDLHGLMVTTPLRTAVDLACKLSRREALAALDAFMRQHGLTHEQMQRLLVRYFRRRGVVQARELVPLADALAESPPESWVRLILIEHGFPRPVLQHWVVLDGEPVYRLDLAYPHARLAIEYDGAEFHTSAEDRVHDRHRRRRLHDEGWTVIVLDKRSFTEAAVIEWTGRVQASLDTARNGRRPI